MTSRLPELSTARRAGPVTLADAMIIAILRTIQLGWQTATDVAASDAVVLSYELPMTHRLRTGMRRAVDSSDNPCRLRITPGTEVIPSDDAPSAGLTDISIYVGRLEGHDPHAIIECKRVARGDSRLCRLYVVEGMDRFRSGKYGADHAQGFMVGFVVRGDADGAVVAINRYLRGRHRQMDQLTTSDLLAEGWVRQSCHSRQNLPGTTLHHAFLLVPKASRKVASARMPHSQHSFSSPASLASRSASQHPCASEA